MNQEVVMNDVEFAGLSDAEVLNIRQKHGYNEIPLSKSRSFFSLLFTVISEPMFILLIAAATIFFLLGEKGDAAILLISVVVVIGITFLQERRSERAIESLRDLSSPRAEVIRNGIKQRIAGRDVVPGDLIILSEGDRVPADARLINNIGLTVDESILTGESLPVVKHVDDLSLNMVYSGTMVVAGTAIARVVHTGSSTEMGKIGKSLVRITDEKSLLELEVNELVKRFAAAGFIVCIVIVVILGKATGQWLEAFLTGITLSIALLPEEFPVVITLFQALGALRLSKENVLTRQSRAIRTMGAVTVLCADKTGTITMNKMQLRSVSTLDEFADVEEKHLPEVYHTIIEYGILASRKDPFDPMEKALVEASKYSVDPEHFHSDWSFIQEYGLSSKLLSVSHVWKPLSSDEYIVAAKGAPEAIADLCHLPPDVFSAVDEKVRLLSDRGLRVIGVAKAKFKSGLLPEDQHAFNFEFVGLLGFYDPVRPGVNEAIQQCYRAGVRVIMITGDHVGTAKKIADSIGLKTAGVVSGDQLNAMNEAEFLRTVLSVNVFARTVPEQKLRIVEALKSHGEVVAMTGDGVNDAPALKSSHIGVAMGSRGSDVAREASDIVLLDDNFNTIVKGIRSGRRIFDNMQKALSFVFAVHIPIAGITLASVFFGWPLVLFPVHVVFLELIIDPTCSVAFEAEAEEEGIMDRPPYGLSEKMFNRKMVMNAFYQGTVASAGIIGIFYFSINKGDTENEARALAFTTMLLMNLALILVNRSKSFFTKDLSAIGKVMKMIMLASVVILLITLFIPHAREVFRFELFHISDMIYVLIVLFAATMLFEAGKFLPIFQKRKTP